MRKLTKAQRNMLRELAGEKLHRKQQPRSRWQQEMILRALIDRGLIERDGWVITEAGRRALSQAEGGAE